MMYYFYYINHSSCYFPHTCIVYMATDEYTTAVRYFLSKHSEYTITGTPKPLDLGTLPPCSSYIVCSNITSLYELLLVTLERLSA